MSLLTRQGRITVKAFASVPALADLPEIQQQSGSASNTSSFQSTGGDIDLSEGCILTKSVKYTHQLIHWVNTVRDGDPSEVEYLIEHELQIIPYEHFSLNDPCNLTYLEAFVHTSLDLYAFIAITASSSTLCDLIKMVKDDNNRRQLEVDESGHDLFRNLNFKSSSFTNPEYELVAIHPEHFLPCGSVLSIFHSATSTSTNYVSARDRCLRKSPESDSPCLPAFFHVTEGCTRHSELDHVNIFLVILNAEIKFHRYLHMISENPPPTPLPANVLALMHLTVELVDLLYWEPVPTKGSQGEAFFLERKKSRPKTRKFYKLPSVFSAGVDFETQRAYGRALMSGHDYDYDPALFENAIPINDSTKQFSEEANVEAWRQSIGSDT